ncbi:NAD-dependent epimerase/dehydratase family protein [Paucibacter sp. TC2R-5]|uniref:NAD-dependent epimerase/dehydratase family protein n=1 Tax=Paucibacter sp. TC2R-5 TaxID=2893555 RepID=UPI0021E3EA7B|nr:NAD-dependent epimerase/dehydratase family protein [Paucibacter sp. TC2R-5]MCV2357416.1 NAD-dependent epimerase/dehydratase family protein [Paucibacter sp. TC2R-5]
MKILILGGTQFLGRHMAALALAAGHEVTLFNRGNHGHDLFPAAEQIRGDRLLDLSALRGRRWDAVFDASCYLPSAARRSAELLADAVEHYCLISSISVFPQINADTVETSSLAQLSAEQLAAAEAQATGLGSQSGGGYGAAYGGLKALCERELSRVMGSRALIVRPGFIIGPYDYSPRLRYWLERMSEGGRVLAPGRPGRPVRLIDARDIAAWCLALAQARTGGIFNATGPDGQTMGDLLLACRAATGLKSELVWCSEAELEAAGAVPFQDLPYWLLDADNAMMEARSVAAVAAGLCLRPLLNSLLDTADCLRGQPPLLASTLSRMREQELLLGR